MSDKKEVNRQARLEAKQRRQEIKEKRKQEKVKRDKKEGRERFELIKMWMYTVAAAIQKDRGIIPNDIGNKILITTNMYVTKLFLNSVVQITEMGLLTPTQFTQDLVEYVREKGGTAVIDFTFKRQHMNVNTAEAGLKSRRRNWEYVCAADNVTDAQKERAARCLYTCEQLDAGESLTYTRLFVTIRAKTGTELRESEKLVYSYLLSIGASYLPINSQLENTMQYISILSDRTTKEIKDSKALITSERTLSQMLPNICDSNGDKGLWCGINVINNQHYRINFEDITIARNIYAVAPSGVGKTVLIQNMAMSALERPNWRVCAMDIKGNELSRMCRAVGGVIVSLTPESRFYINYFKMDKGFTTYEGSADYFRKNFNWAKASMVTMSGEIKQEVVNEMNSLLEEFLDYVYVRLGVLPNNLNTWEATMGLTPFDIYDQLREFTTPGIIQKYPKSAVKLITTLKEFMSRGGSRSHVLSEEFDMKAILAAKMVTFNFGLLKYDSVGQLDRPLFNLKYDYMTKINSDYVAYNYAHGFETFKILEESQIVPPETLRKYAEEFTLRRSQRQTTVLLGNSIQALMESGTSKALIENVRGLFVGHQTGEAKEEIIKQFDLEKYRNLLESIGMTEERGNSFLFINGMQDDPIIPVVKVFLRPDKKYLFKPTNEFN